MDYILIKDSFVNPSTKIKPKPKRANNIYISQPPEQSTSKLDIKKLNSYLSCLFGFIQSLNATSKQLLIKLKSLSLTHDHFQFEKSLNETINNIDITFKRLKTLPQIKLNDNTKSDMNSSSISNKKISNHFGYMNNRQNILNKLKIESTSISTTKSRPSTTNTNSNSQGKQTKPLQIKNSSSISTSNIYKNNPFIRNPRTNSSIKTNSNTMNSFLTTIGTMNNSFSNDNCYRNVNNSNNINITTTHTATEGDEDDIITHIIPSTTSNMTGNCSNNNYNIYNSNEEFIKRANSVDNHVTSVNINDKCCHCNILSKKTIDFIIQMRKLQEAILQKSSEVNEGKRCFEKIKKDLFTLAKSIYKNNFYFDEEYKLRELLLENEDLKQTIEKLTVKLQNYNSTATLITQVNESLPQLNVQNEIDNLKSELSKSNIKRNSLNKQNNELLQTISTLTLENSTLKKTNEEYNIILLQLSDVRSSLQNKLSVTPSSPSKEGKHETIKSLPSHIQFNEIISQIQTLITQIPSLHKNINKSNTNENNVFQQETNTYKSLIRDTINNVSTFLKDLKITNENTSTLTTTTTMPLKDNGNNNATCSLTVVFEQLKYIVVVLLQKVNKIKEEKLMYKNALENALKTKIHLSEEQEFEIDFNTKTKTFTLRDIADLDVNYINEDNHPLNSPSVHSESERDANKQFELNKEQLQKIETIQQELNIQIELNKKLIKENKMLRDTMSSSVNLKLLGGNSDIYAPIRSALEKLMNEIELSVKVKELLNVILRLIGVNEDDIEKLFSEKERKRYHKKLFG